MSAKDSCGVKKYVSVPPDGGWGYVIVVAVIINISTSTMFASSYELLLKEFLHESGMGSKYSSLMHGIGTMCTAIAGFLTSPLLSIMSPRLLALVAALIFNAGVICIMFVKSVLTFHICHGILQGLGMGFTYNLSSTILNEYFVKRRLMAISLVQSAVAIISMAAPLFLKWSLEKYGFRETILLISAITMNNFIAVALMQPVKWHTRRLQETDGSCEKLFQNKKQNEEAGIVSINRLTTADSNLTIASEKMFPSSKTGKTSGINFRKITNLIVDKALCKEFLVSCVCAGPALAMFADTFYFGILPQALCTAGWEQKNITLAHSLYSFGDLAMRVLFVVLSNWLHKWGSQEIYILGVTLALVTRLGMLWSKSFIALMVYITLVGASHCAVSILTPLVVADAVAPDKFTAALGMLMMLSGLINVVLGPAIDAVKVLSKSYGPAFYLIESCFAIIVLFWSIELCYKKNQHKRLQRREYLRKKNFNK